MPIIVQKFGGSSVADSQKILAAARKAIRAQKEGNQVVVVVSAMGDNTDLLIGLAKQITDQPPAREMDMLLSTGEQVSVALMAMAIHSLGHKAISMTGADRHCDRQHAHQGPHPLDLDRPHPPRPGRGEDRHCRRVSGDRRGLQHHHAGRGGSDTTAVALAAVLGAKSCEIYTDVDGVYTTDPRMVPEARKMSQISYDEMLELATAGAGVMHNRSIEFAKKFAVPVHVRSSFSDNPGTMIVAEPEIAGRAVCGAAMIKSDARVTIRNVPDRPGAAVTIFAKIAAKNIAVDMIVQNVADDGRTDISFTVVRDDLPATLKAVEDGVKELGAEGYTCDDEVSKISIVGLGMATQTGVAERMFRALAERGINIIMITTSEIKISVLVAREHALEALRTVHGEFALEKDPDGGARGDAGGAGGGAEQFPRNRRPHGENGGIDHRGHQPRRVAGPADRARAAGYPGAGRPGVRRDRRGGDRRRHDRAERGPAGARQHLLHRPPDGTWPRRFASRPSRPRRWAARRPGIARAWPSSRSSAWA